MLDGHVVPFAVTIVCFVVVLVVVMAIAGELGRTLLLLLVAQGDRFFVFIVAIRVIIRICGVIGLVFLVR